jgi:hypothetical protein
MESLDGGLRTNMQEVFAPTLYQEVTAPGTEMHISEVVGTMPRGAVRGLVVCPTVVVLFL